MNEQKDGHQPSRVFICAQPVRPNLKRAKNGHHREDEVILFAAQFQDRGGDDRDGENDAQPIEIDLRFLQRVIFERHRSDDDPKAKNQQRQHNPVSHPADRRRQRHVETAFLVRDLWVFSLSTLNQQHEGGADQQ